MAYIYCHRRNDNNEIFYIGISNDDQNNKRRDRAYATARNAYWKEVVETTDYTVQFLYENVSIKFALAKEIELIEMYGTLEKGGILTNRNFGTSAIVCKPDSEKHVSITFMVCPKNKAAIKAKVDPIVKKLDK